jgi:anti-sigma regulatory factor (Ser/Thr protein kinase)
MIPADLPSRGALRTAADADETASGRGTPACAHHARAAGVMPRGAPGPSAPEVTSAATARAHVLAVVRGHRGGPAVPATERAVTDLLLVTSELVSNALGHGGGLMAFAATATPEGIRLSVHDHRTDIPAAAFGPGALPTGHEGGGYGWPLIIKLARDIAVERCAGGGKVVSVLVPPV